MSLNGAHRYVKMPGIPWEAGEKERCLECCKELETEARSVGDDSCAGSRQAPGWQCSSFCAHHKARVPEGGGFPQGAQPTPQQRLPMPHPGHTRMTHPPVPAEGEEWARRGLSSQDGHRHDSTSPRPPLGGQCHRLGGRNRKAHELTRQAGSPTTFCLPVPNYTKLSGQSSMAGGCPQGAGRDRGPRQKCTVMVKVPPRPGHRARRSFLEGQEWRHNSRRQEMPLRGHCWGRVRGASQRPRPKLVGSRIGGWEAAAPQPQLPAFRGQSISWQRKKRAEGQKVGEIGRGRGHKGRGSWEGEGSYANGRIDRVPQRLIKAPAAAVGITGVEARAGSLFSLAQGGSEGEAGHPKQKEPLPPAPQEQQQWGTSRED